MRELTDDLDPMVVGQIDARLETIRAEHAVAVPWAIESGSRAWGFPSVDSDYDCRFFFVRPMSAYLDPWPPRDVIETPLVGLLDVNGWDLGKAVKLATQGNATVGEWLRSPLVYDGDPLFRDRLLTLVDEVSDRAAIIRHYQHVGRDQWSRSGADDGPAPVLKRVFYALRPAAALHWMLEHPSSAVPPMNLGQLLDEVPPPGRVARAIDELVAAKAVSRELGAGPVDRVLVQWIEDQLSAFPEQPIPMPTPERRSLAAVAFRSMLERWAP